MKTLKSSILVNTLTALLGFALTAWFIFPAIAATPVASKIEDAFPALLKAGISKLTPERAREMLDKLEPADLLAIRKFLGEKEVAKLRSSVSDDMKNIVDHYFSDESVVRVTPSQFKNALPVVFATVCNAISPDLLRDGLADVSGNHLAGLSFYLGASGQYKMFSMMNSDQAAVILDRTPVWVFIENGRRKYDSISQYSAVLYKRERIGGDLQGIEKIQLKYRKTPRAIYMKWLDGPFKGRELIYNKRLINNADIRVRESGLLGVIPVTIDANSVIARRGTNHIALEVGLENILDMIERDYKKSFANGDLTRINHGIVNLDGRKVYKLETQLPKKHRDKYYGMRINHYIDYLRALEIKVEVYNWENQLYESYYYDEIRLNAKFSDDDFNPDNPAYDL